MSSRRRCVRISNCSRLFLSMCGERFTVKRSISVGSGMGPRTRAPVRLAVFTISRVLVSSTRWSNAFRRMRMFWLSMAGGPEPCSPSGLLLYAGDDAGADGAATLADGEAQSLVHGDRGDQLHLHRHV